MNTPLVLLACALALSGCANSSAHWGDLRSTTVVYLAPDLPIPVNAPLRAAQPSSGLPAPKCARYSAPDFESTPMAPVRQYAAPDAQQEARRIVVLINYTEELRRYIGKLKQRQRAAYAAYLAECSG